MTNALHNRESLQERLEAVEECAQTLRVAIELLQKKEIEHIPLRYDAMVPPSLKRLQKFADEALMQIKRWKPPEAPSLTKRH